MVVLSGQCCWVFLDFPRGPRGCVVFRFSGRNAYKSILWVNIWPKNSNFRSNLIAKIDSAGRDLFVANGKWPKTSKIINFHQFFENVPFAFFIYFFRFSGRNDYKSILWINICPKNSNFRSNPIAQIDSAGRVLFVAPGKWSKTSKITNFQQFFENVQ